MENVRTHQKIGIVCDFVVLVLEHCPNTITKTRAKERNTRVLSASEPVDSLCDGLHMIQYVLLPPRSIFVEMRPPALGPCAPCYERPDTICLEKAI